MAGGSAFAPWLGRGRLEKHSFIVKDYKFIAPLRCSECGGNAHLIRRSLHAVENLEIRVFECHECGHKTEQLAKTTSFSGAPPHYIGVSRTTFSTLTLSTVALDKCSSAFTWAAVICASCLCMRPRTRRAPDSRAHRRLARIYHEFALPNDAALLILNKLLG